MISLRCVVRVVVWGCLILYFVILTVLAYLFYAWGTEQENDEVEREINEDSVNTHKYLGIAFWIIDGISLIIFCCLYN